MLCQALNEVDEKVQRVSRCTSCPTLRCASFATSHARPAPPGRPAGDRVPPPRHLIMPKRPLDDVVLVIRGTVIDSPELTTLRVRTHAVLGVRAIGTVAFCEEGHTEPLSPGSSLVLPPRARAPVTSLPPTVPPEPAGASRGRRGGAEPRLRHP